VLLQVLAWQFQTVRGVVSMFKCKRVREEQVTRLPLPFPHRSRCRANANPKPVRVHEL